jgi:uncharacterized membrane protein YkvA (DUF1232 family)
MFRLVQNLLNQLSGFVRMLSIIWLDVRMPLSARVLLVFAPLYWICPFDFNPDFLPGGYTDDLWIVAIVILIAMKLVPLAVLCDARKATAQAVCGIICLGLTMMPSEHEANHPDAALNQNVISTTRHNVAYSQNVHETVAKCVSAAKELAAACGGIHQTGAPPRTFIKTAHRENEQHLPFPKMRIARVTSTSLLLARGGQFQLYGIDGDAALATPLLPVANLAQVMCLPSALAGGFFLTNHWFTLIQLTYKDKSLVETAAC